MYEHEDLMNDANLLIDETRVSVEEINGVMCKKYVKRMDTRDSSKQKYWCVPLASETDTEIEGNPFETGNILRMRNLCIKDTRCVWCIAIAVLMQYTKDDLRWVIWNRDEAHAEKVARSHYKAKGVPSGTLENVVSVLKTHW